MIFLIIGFILSLAGIMKDFLEKKAENKTANPRKKSVFLYWGTVLTFIGAISTFWGGYDAKTSQDKSDKDHNAAYRNLQDSLNKNLVSQLKNNSDSNIQTFTSALAKYHLEYVDGQVGIKSFIKDSIETGIPGMYIPTVFAKHYFTNDKDTIKFHFPFMNSGNCPIVVSMIGDLAFDLDGTLTYGWKLNAFKDRNIAQGSAYDYMTGALFEKLPNRIYFNINSRYSDVSKKKKFYFTEIIVWDKAQDTIGLPASMELKDSIQKFFRKKI